MGHDVGSSSSIPGCAGIEDRGSSSCLSSSSAGHRATRRATNTTINMATFETVIAATAEMSLETPAENAVDAAIAGTAAVDTFSGTADPADEGKEEHKKSSDSSSSRVVLVGDEVPATPKTKQAMREGMYGHLTPQQEEALKIFQDQAKPSDIEASRYSVETVQQVALRFLRARAFDVTKALALLDECSQKLTEMSATHWASVDPDVALNCDLAALKNFYPHTQSGFDKFNRPILYEHTGGMHPAAVLQMTTKSGLINYHWWCMETSLDQKFTEAATRATSTVDNPDGTTIHNISTCVILDFKDLSLQHVSQKMLDQCKLYIGLDNVCYPELLGKMFVINAPYLAVQTWAIVKRWLDPRTQSKIEILGPGPETIKRLHEFIAPDQLPRAYGGTAPDIFHRKPGCEAATVPRAGKLTKTVSLPPGKKLTVDSYIHDGQVDITLTFTSASSPSASPQGLCPPVSVKAPTNVDDGPTRNVQVVPGNPEAREIFVTWSNSSKFSSRPFIYVLTVEDDE